MERDAPARDTTNERGAALLGPLEHALCTAGLRVVDVYQATAADVLEHHHSSWAKRLSIPARRPAWALTAAKR